MTEIHSKKKAESLAALGDGERELTVGVATARARGGAKGNGDARDAEAAAALPGNGNGAPKARNGTPRAVERGVGPVPLAQTSGTIACPHLGLEQDPFSHQDSPSSEHRCYLWMQRDRIDRTHQELFCLSAQHERCPWLSISAPAKPKPLGERAKQTVAGRMAEGFEDVETGWLRNVLIALLKAWHVAQPVLVQLGIWLLAALRFAGSYLMWPLRWLSRHYRDIEHAILRGLAALGGALWRATLGKALPARSAQRSHAALAQEELAAFAPATEEARAAATLYLQRGMEAMRDGDNAGALRRFRLATAADEQNEQAWLLRGALAETPEEKAECLRRALAINPRNQRASGGLAQLGAGSAPRRAESQPATGPARTVAARPSIATDGDLLKAGLEAMRAGNEDLAYHYFGLATAADPGNEQAWYWRAKTAPTVTEVIRSLERIIAINPANAKAQADLSWAMQRQQREQGFEINKTRAAPEPKGPSAKDRLVAQLRQGVLQVASACAFLLGLGMGLPYMLKLVEVPVSPEYQAYLNMLPSFQLAGLPAPLGDWTPLALAVLLFHAAFKLADGGGLGLRVWTALLGAAGAGLMFFYVTNAPASPLGTLVALIAIAAALAGQDRPAEHPVGTPWGIA